MPAGVFRPYTLTDILAGMSDQNGQQQVDTTTSGVGFFAEADESVQSTLAVTATASGPNTFPALALTVRVVTGAKAATLQTGATASTDAGASPQVAITPNATGSWVYGAATNTANDTAFTPNAATIFSDNFPDAVNGCCYGTFRSATATTAATPITVGASAPAVTGHVAAAEILASTTLAEDGSSPAAVNATAGLTVTTAPFTPPPGSLLVAMVSADHANSSPITMTVVDSLGLTWTQLAGDTEQVATVWVAQIPSMDSATATAQLPTGWDGGEWNQFAWEAELNLLATTGLSGFALQNGTPTILSWTAPNDGQMHRVLIAMIGKVTSAETGGILNATGQDPGGNGFTSQLDGGGHGAGATIVGSVRFMPVAPGTTFSIVQGSALTAGAATAWFELWGQ